MAAPPAASAAAVATHPANRRSRAGFTIYGNSPTFPEWFGTVTEPYLPANSDENRPSWACAALSKEKARAYYSDAVSLSCVGVPYEFMERFHDTPWSRGKWRNLQNKAAAGTLEWKDFVRFDVF